MVDKKESVAFNTWSHENLAKFAAECYAALEQEKLANEQLRQDFKDAMQVARILNLKDNKL